MRTISIDIETYSSVDLTKAGVYRYAESPDFEILLFAYAVDGGEVEVVDVARGEHIPKEIIDALTDERIHKYAFNAQFERVCLSRFLGYPVGEYINPDSWFCTMVWSATLGLPLSLVNSQWMSGVSFSVSLSLPSLISVMVPKRPSYSLSALAIIWSPTV